MSDTPASTNPARASQNGDSDVTEVKTAKAAAEKNSAAARETVLSMDMKPRIAVIGVGGAGGNAVNNMIAAGLDGVSFIVANTDAQALAASEAETRIQLGVALTEGLGAGSKPEIGAAAAEEAAEQIRKVIDGCHMVFVAAGMGGGTGTGAAAVIARIAHELNILTVGVVTKPFHFEGQRRMRAAETGVAELAQNVDTLIAIPNQNLFRIANEKTTFAEAFELADEVLLAGISCVTDLIVREGLINLDFADVRAIMLDMGAAMMGTGEASGENRAVEAAELAIANPLLDDVTLQGAKGLLVSISGSADLKLFEVDQAANRIRKEVDPDANIIVGANIDEGIEDRIRVSIVASGLRRPGVEAQPPVQRQHAPVHAGNPQAAPQTLQRPPPPSMETQPPRPQTMAQRPIPGLATAQTPPPRPPQHQPAQRRQEPGQTLQSVPSPERRPGLANPVATPQRAAPRPTVSPAPPTSASATRGNPGAVQIEVGPPKMLTAGSLAGPTAPTASDTDHDDLELAEAAFVPRQPETVKRTPPRMPRVEEFPPIAQREIENSKRIGTDGGSGKRSVTPPAPRRRSRLFARLKGSFQDTVPDEVTDLDDIAEQIDAMDDSVDQTPAASQQDVEIPGFFRRKASR